MLPSLTGGDKTSCCDAWLVGILTFQSKMVPLQASSNGSSARGSVFSLSASLSPDPYLRTDVGPTISALAAREHSSVSLWGVPASSRGRAQRLEAAWALQHSAAQPRPTAKTVVLGNHPPGMEQAWDSVAASLFLETLLGACPALPGALRPAPCCAFGCAASICPQSARRASPLAGNLFPWAVVQRPWLRSQLGLLIQ